MHNHAYEDAVWSLGPIILPQYHALSFGLVVTDLLIFWRISMDNTHMMGLYLWLPAMQLVPHLGTTNPWQLAPVTKMLGRCISCRGKRPMFRGELLISHTVGHFWVVDVPIVKDYVIVPGYGYSRNTPSPKTNILIHMLEHIGVFKLVQPDLMHQQLEPKTACWLVKLSLPMIRSRQNWCKDGDH